MEVCKIMPRVYACMEFISARPNTELEALQQHRKNNHPATQKQSRDRFVNVLRGEILLRQQADGDGWWDDIDSIVENVSDQYHGGSAEFSEEQVNYRPSIYQAHVVGGSMRYPRREEDREASVTDIGTSIHPVRFPYWALTDSQPTGGDDSDVEESHSVTQVVEEESAQATQQDNDKDEEVVGSQESTP
jgi:hypothetical protein